MTIGRGHLLAALAAGAAVTVGTAMAARAADPQPQPTPPAARLVDAMSPPALYRLRCSGCHGLEGMGAPSAGIPPFPGSIGAIAADDGGRAYIMHVPGVVGSGLNNAQLAAVMNYVLDQWSGDKARPVARFTPDEVTRLRAVPVGDVVSYRRDLSQRLAKGGVAIADYPWP